jgi:site-specific recombinase XerD
MNELINSDWTWEEALSNYKDEIDESGRHANSTIRMRFNLLNKVVEYAKKRGVERPSQSSKTLLQEYFKSRSLASSTKVTQKRFLAHFYEFLEENYVVIDNYANLLPTPKVYKKERIIPNKDEIQNIYNDVFTKKNPAILTRDLVIIDLLINPAIRISELVALRIQDVFFEEKQILVTRKGGHQQLLPVKIETLDNIKEMLEYRTTYEISDSLFITAKRYNGMVRALGVRGAQKIVEKYMLKNFKLNKLSYGPHLLRHAGGTMMCRNGADLPTVQSILGHRNIQTTMIYQHTDNEQRRKAIELGEDFSSPGKRNGL